MESEREDAPVRVGSRDRQTDAGAECVARSEQAESLFRPGTTDYFRRGAHAVPGESECPVGQSAEREKCYACRAGPSDLLECRAVASGWNPHQPTMTSLLQAHLSVAY